MELQGKRIAFLGDSITAGAGASVPENKYVEVFKKNCKLSEAYNYGIGGTRISKQKKPSKNSEWDKDFISRVAAMEENVDAVVVFGGTNDFGHGDIPLGAFGDTTEDTFCGCCHILMTSLVKKYPEVPIVVLTPLHRLGENKLVNEIGLDRVPLASYVSAIREMANGFSLPVLDLFAISGMQPEISEQNKLYFTDGLHPNDLGHKKIAGMLENFIRNQIF